MVGNRGVLVSRSQTNKIRSLFLFVVHDDLLICSGVQRMMVEHTAGDLRCVRGETMFADTKAYQKFTAQLTFILRTINPLHLPT
jgi:hypothetical protein